MKPSVCFLLSTMLLLFAAQSGWASPNKRALIIGIGAYKPGDGWPTLHGDADVDLIKSALLKTGFDEARVATLKNSNAGKQGIANAMKTLLADCRPGDIIVFHFSGHGQQIQDMNGDEADGLDEALVPYDAPASDITHTYNGSLHLTDDELGVWFDKVRAKIGAAGQLIVFLDACHTGTASRGGNAIVRGGMPPFILSPATFQTKLKENDPNQSGYYQPAGARGADGEGKFILFSAAQSDKSDYEYDNKIGSLTYALADVFNNQLLSSSTSFRDIYEQVRNTLAILVPYQNPELEGDKDVTVFGGDIVVQEPYFYVHKVREKEITISGGTLMQVDKDAVIGFYKAGTRNKKTAVPFVSGKVVKATTFEAIVLLNNPYNHDSIAQCRAMMMQEGSKDRRTRVYISNGFSPVAQKLIDTLSSVRQVLLVPDMKEASLIVSDASLDGTNVIRIISASENTDLVNPVDITKPALIYSCKGNSRSTDAMSYVVSVIKNYSVNSILKTTDFRSNTYSLRIELLPTKLDKNENVMKVLPDTNNTPTVTAYSTAYLRITNNGNAGGFLTLIEFNPNGVMCPLIDVDNAIRIEAGKSHDFKIDKFDPPYGRYLIKGFLTEHPIGNELSLVLSQQSGVRGIQDGIAGILGDMLDNPAGTRNMQIGETPGGSVSFSYQLLDQ